jgi:hypothetical protein
MYRYYRDAEKDGNASRFDSLRLVLDDKLPSAQHLIKNL